MASSAFFAQVDLYVISALETPTSGFVGFGAKADGLYQKTSAGVESRLLTTVDQYWSRASTVISPATTDDQVQITGAGDKANGLLYIGSTSTNSRGTLARLGFYTYLNQNSAGETVWAWGMRYDATANAWVRMYTSGTNYLPFINVSTSSKIIIGGATSNLTTDANPTPRNVFYFDVDSLSLGIGNSPTNSFDTWGSARIRSLGTRSTETLLVMATSTGVLKSYSMTLFNALCIADSSNPASGYTVPAISRTVNNNPSAYYRVFNTELKQASSVSLSDAGYSYVALTTVSPYLATTANGPGVIQLAWDVGTGTDVATLPNLFIRRGSDSTWGNWYKLYGSHNLNKSTVDFDCKDLTAAGTLTLDSTAYVSNPTDVLVFGSNSTVGYSTLSELKDTQWSYGQLSNDIGQTYTDLFEYSVDMTHSYYHEFEFLVRISDVKNDASNNGVAFKLVCTNDNSSTITAMIVGGKSTSVIADYLSNSSESPAILANSSTDGVISIKGVLLANKSNTSNAMHLKLQGKKITQGTADFNVFMVRIDRKLANT